ncbi:MAG: heparinase II/III family protein [Lentisphaerae bacterium]|nr:heparinase II/III family protein [Lentisphaerota bacterium]
MTPSKTLERRIADLGRRGELHRREADILSDMIRAGRAEVSLRLDFLERYLPKPLRGPLRTQGPLIGSAAELAAARRRMKSDPISIRLAQRLAAQTRRYLRVGGPDWIDWRTRRNPRLWNTRMAHWKFAAALDSLAWTWRFHGDRACAAAVRGILLTIARTRHGWRPLGCNYGRPYQGWLNDNLLDLGHATLMPAIAYDAVRPLLTQVERKEIAAYFEPFLYRALSHRYDGMARPGHNFSPVGFGGVGLLALALWEDIPTERRAVLSEVLAWAEAYARFTLATVGGSDGAAVEGSAYGSASLRYLALFAEGLFRRAGRDLFAHPGWGRFARYLVMETLPGGGAFNNFNDNHYRTHTGFWPLVARRSGDPAGDWAWFHHNAATRPIVMEKPSAWNDVPYVLLFRNPGHDNLTPAALGVRPVHAFKDQQHFVARTGWGRNDLHVSFQCTRGRPGGHSQQDRLNFTIYALGECFAVDSGYGLERIGPGTTEVRRLGRLAESHNQVLVDSRGQHDTIAPDAGKLVRTGARGRWAWAVGDAIGAYEGLAQVRRGILVRLTAGTPVVIIADWTKPAKTRRHRYDWLLHTAAGNRVRRLTNGAFAIKGRQAALFGCQVSSGRRTSAQDTWLGHPRLRLTTLAREYVALTVLAAGRVRRASGKHQGLAIEWADAQGTGCARLCTRKTGKGRSVVRFQADEGPDWIPL